jgi:hypothetical protein
MEIPYKRFMAYVLLRSLVEFWWGNGLSEQAARDGIRRGRLSGESSLEADICGFGPFQGRRYRRVKARPEIDLVLTGELLDKRFIA